MFECMETFRTQFPFSYYKFSVVATLICAIFSGTLSQNL